MKSLRGFLRTKYLQRRLEQAPVVVDATLPGAEVTVKGPGPNPGFCACRRHHVHVSMASIPGDGIGSTLHGRLLPVGRTACPGDPDDPGSPQPTDNLSTRYSKVTII